MDFGIAFDIGTTTIAGSLVNLSKKKEDTTFSLLNPQIKWGGDILSRVEAIVQNHSLLPTLQSETIDACNRIIEVILQDAGVSPSAIDRIAIAGNPLMEHIFLGLSPLSLGKTPYRPLFKEGRRLKARDSGLSVKPDAEVYLFPLISGFAGGDMAALLLFTCMLKDKSLRQENDRRGRHVTLTIDLGTNTEIALHTEEGIWVTSAAAGPAFEGGGIKHGMMAEDGAIGKAQLAGYKIEIEVIGGGRPKGICGSGLVDIAASMLKANVIDITGRIKCREEIDSNIANRIEEGEENSFLVYRDAIGDISISQKDIRALQLAKGAILAGIKLLMDKRGVVAEEIKKVFIAGTFGNNIGVGGLVEIGVIPGIWRNRVSFVGDGALEGAKMVLLSDNILDEVENLARNAHYLILSGSPIFQKEFLKGMDFKSF